jgi:hypothetical protein
MYISKGKNAAALAIANRIQVPTVFPLLQYALKVRVLLLCGETAAAETLARHVLHTVSPHNAVGDERAAYFYLKYALSSIEDGSHTDEYWRECYRSGASNAAMSCFGFR